MNPINVSGTDLEDRVENYLIESKLSYTRAKPGAPEIDFKIETENGMVYADCTNQNSGGSVEEKLPHKLWKYSMRYNYDSVIIVTGTHKYSKHVKEHCEDVAKMKGFVLQLLDYDKFVNYLKDAKSLNPLGI